MLSLLQRPDSCLRPFLCLLDNAVPPGACCAVQVAMAGAALLGLAMAEVGVSIQHDANHGAYLPRTWWSWLMAATLDAVRGLLPCCLHHCLTCVCKACT